MFIIYFNIKPLPNQTKQQKLNEYLFSLVSFFGIMIVSLLMAAIAFLLYFGGILLADGIEKYGQVLGSISGAVTLFIWVPQIYTTFMSGVCPFILSLHFIN